MSEQNQPSEKFQALFNMSRIGLKIVGADIFRPKYKMTLVTHIINAILIFYLVFSISTVIQEYHHDKKIIVEASCFLGYFFQCGGKMLTAQRFPKEYNSLYDDLSDMYITYSVNSNKEYHKVLKLSNYLMKIELYGLSILYYIVGFLVGIAPILIYLLTGEQTILLPFHVPGVNIKTTTGYFITLFVHSIYLLGGIIGSLAGDQFTIIFVTHLKLWKDILKVKFMELDDIIENQLNNTKIVREYIKDISIWHEKYCRYGETLNEINFVNFFFAMAGNALSIALSLFIIMTGDWIGAYPFMILCFGILYVYCFLGTFAEIINDEVETLIYNNKWYFLPTSEQKMFQFMLVKAQRTNTLTFGGIATIGVNLALQITKTLYSYFMMLLQFLEN